MSDLAQVIPFFAPKIELDVFLLKILEVFFTVPLLVLEEPLEMDEAAVAETVF